MMRYSFCDGWEFTPVWTEDFGKGLPVDGVETVRLPHNPKDLPLHYAQPADYEMLSGYRRRFRVPSIVEAPRLFLRNRIEDLAVGVLNHFVRVLRHLHFDGVGTFVKIKKQFVPR